MCHIRWDWKWFIFYCNFKELIGQRKAKRDMLNRILLFSRNNVPIFGNSFHTMRLGNGTKEKFFCYRWTRTPHGTALTGLKGAGMKERRVTSFRLTIRNSNYCSIFKLILWYEKMTMKTSDELKPTYLLSSLMFFL